MAPEPTGRLNWGHRSHAKSLFRPIKATHRTSAFGEAVLQGPRPWECELRLLPTLALGARHCGSSRSRALAIEVGPMPDQHQLPKDIQVRLGLVPGQARSRHPANEYSRCTPG